MQFSQPPFLTGNLPLKSGLAPRGSTPCGLARVTLTGSSLPKFQPRLSILLALPLLVAALGGCGWMPPGAAQSGPRGERGRGEDGPVAVETETVTLGVLGEALTYTGTTEAATAVTVRAQVEGQILALTLDVGDVVGQGQVVAQLAPTLLSTGVNQSQAELGARQAEVLQAQTEVSDAQTAVAEARLRVEQAQIEADRWQQLAAAGAASSQEAEQAQLVLATAQQALRSAQERVRVRQQAVTAAQGRVGAQRAVVAQTQERLAQTVVRSPLSGVVLSRALAAGDFAAPGTELLQVGDLSSLRIAVAISEFDLGQISRGQPVGIRFDAFPDLEATGRVTRISPVADATSRLIPVEVTLDNPGGQVGVGLLARLEFFGDRERVVTVPESALQGEDTLFVVANPEGETPIAQARRVTLGPRQDGQVGIVAGLNPGEQVIVRSDRPLEDGQAIRLSLLSR